jgi:hypothetical protein
MCNALSSIEAMITTSDIPSNLRTSRGICVFDVQIFHQAANQSMLDRRSNSIPEWLIRSRRQRRLTASATSLEMRQPDLDLNLGSTGENRIIQN